jgi:outer membrane receptor protein involved in Fe transport
VAGLRADYWRADVDSNLAENSGTRDQLLLSPKLSFLLGPWKNTEVYLNAGTGFHSNDARGATIRVGPRTGDVEGVAAVGVAFEDLGPLFGALRLRYLGPRPLIEDDSVRAAASSALVNARLGYTFANGLSLALDVFNLFDREVSDIDYFYASRLPGEPEEGVEDIHFHPAEPRSARLTVRWEL